MQLNTVDQAERLKSLGIISKDVVCAIPHQVGDNEWEQELALRHSDNVEPEADILGPELTLDELHSIFEGIWEDNPKIEMPILDITRDDTSPSGYYPLWATAINKVGHSCHLSPRTANHAEDWTEILIWLIQEGHVPFEKVNSILIPPTVGEQK